MNSSTYYLITHTDGDVYIFDASKEWTTWLEAPSEWAIPQHKLINGVIHASTCGQEECCPYVTTNIKEVKEISQYEYLRLYNKRKNG